MRLFRIISCGSGISTTLRLINGEMQPLIEKKHKSKINQYLATVVANIVGISCGTCLGWSSPAIAKISELARDSPLDFIPSNDQLSWIGSILSLGGLVGPILFSPLPGCIGRKQTLMLTSLVFIASFVFLIFTNDIVSIYIARFLQGIGSGVVMVILPMYIGEIATADCRGILSSFIQIGLVFGILLSYSIGPYVTYIAFQWALLSVPVLFLFAFIFMPDTPHFHIFKNRKQEALQSLQYLRKSKNVDEELEEIQHLVDESMNHSAGIFDVFKGKANRTALMIGVGLCCFQNLSGIDAVLFYNETIFKKADSSLDASMAAIVVAAVMLLPSCVCPVFVDKLGRKKLLLTSAAGMAVALTMMGTFFFCDARGMTNAFGWLPVISLVGFILFYCIGFGPLPFTVLSEMFAPEVKAVASSIAVSTSWSVDFLVTKSFLPLESVVGSYGNFWIFAGFCIFAFIFTALVVFETKGMSLQDIQDRLNGRKRVVYEVKNDVTDLC